MHEKNKFGALWRKAALCGALEGKSDFKLENSVEHYLWREAAFQTTNLALCGAKRRFVTRLEGNLIFSLKTV